MAKKTVATFKTGKGKDFVKVVKTVRTAKGGVTFKTEIVHKDHVKDWLAAAK
jgi:uncharacterized protein DUF4295